MKLHLRTTIWGNYPSKSNRGDIIINSRGYTKRKRQVEIDYDRLHSYRISMKPQSKYMKLITYLGLFKSLTSAKYLPSFILFGCVLTTTFSVSNIEILIVCNIVSYTMFSFMFFIYGNINMFWNLTLNRLPYVSQTPSS